MGKNMILLMIIALSFVSAFGQNATENGSFCTNQTVENISSRGIKLGMSREETINLFAENGRLTAGYSEYLGNELRYAVYVSEVEYQNTLNKLQNQSERMFGLSTITVVPKDKTKFDGIAYYDLGFLDNRLAFFRVHYTKPRWRSREEFTTKLSEILSLPKPQSNTGNPYSVKCGNYSVDFDVTNDDEARYVMWVSANINEVTQQRRKKADDEQREKDIKIFKP